MNDYESGELTWYRSSACDDSGCIEVALASGLVLVRDSCDRTGEVLVISRSGWRAFLRHMCSEQQVDSITRWCCERVGDRR